MSTSPSTTSRSVPARTADGAVEVEDPRFRVWRGSVPSMRNAHRHDDLELNFVISGRLDYLFGGSPLSIAAGEIALFWAATPHRLMPQDPDSEACWIHVPLARVLNWGLPDQDVNELLQGRPLIVPAESVGLSLEAMFEVWRQDLETDEDETAILLETQALVRRVLRQYFRHVGLEARPREFASSESVARVAAMAQFIVAHFRDPIAIADIADAAHLNPNYAMTLFRETIGTTIGGYLTRCRVAEAQRLLLTTRLTMIDIALQSGFGSQSSFYEQFSRTCGGSPGAYRRRLG